MHSLKYISLGWKDLVESTVLVGGMPGARDPCPNPKSGPVFKGDNFWGENEKKRAYGLMIRR